MYVYVHTNTHIPYKVPFMRCKLLTELNVPSAKVEKNLLSIHFAF